MAGIRGDMTTPRRGPHATDEVLLEAGSLPSCPRPGRAICAATTTRETGSSMGLNECEAAELLDEKPRPGSSCC